MFADLADAPWPTCQGGFPANAAWLTSAAISHNLPRAAGSLASLAYAKATIATLLRGPINVAARTARHGSRTHGQATKRERQENTPTGTRRPLTSDPAPKRIS